MRGAICAATAACLFGYAASAQPFEEGKHYEFKPAVYERGETLAPKGAAAAKGLVIWNHGRGNKAASETAPPIARFFGQRGWDVYGLYRGFGVDSRRATYEVLQIALKKSQELGYQKIILMGQSAGGFGSVEAVRYGSEVVGIVALAPAAYGSYSGESASRDWRMNDFMMRDMWEKFQGKPVRVAAAYFNGDVYYEDQVPNTRGPWLAETLTKYGVPNLVVNQPSTPPLYGHSAGLSWTFARRYGACIFELMETGIAPPCSDDDPATLTTFRITLPPASSVDTGEPYAGRWFGTWSGGRLVAIPILRREGNRLIARYISGTGADVQRDAPENLDWPITDTGNGLRRETTNTVFEFRLEGDKLLGTRTPKNNPDDKQTIVMKLAS